MKEGIEPADYKGRGRERDGGWFREIKSRLSGQIDSLITSVSHKWMRDRNAGAGRKINSVILFPLPFYRCRNKILLLWDSSFGSFSPPLMHSNSLLSFLFSPLGLTLLFHWCALAHSLHSLAGRDFNEALVFQIFSLLSPQAFPHNHNNNNNSGAISLNSCGTFGCGTLTARNLF